MDRSSFPGVGGVLSADIAVPEHERELRFYSRVLTTGDPPLWRDDLMNNQGTPVIGLGARGPEYDMLPLQWMPHIQVADVATSVARALELGGDALMQSTDDGDDSQWAVLLDPNGAAFGLIPVVSAESVSPDAASHDAAPRAGCICRLSLAVSNTVAIRDFYRLVVDWSTRSIGMEDATRPHVDYDMLGENGTPAARISHARGADRDLPPVWLMHLTVGDLPESLRRVREGGGEVINATEVADGTVASAVVRDPVGVYFALGPG